jgi:putative endonuclease
VDEQKQRMLRRMAGAYLRTYPRGERQAVSARFDVLSVYLLADAVECELVRNAFDWRDERPEFRF